MGEVFRLPRILGGRRIEKAPAPDWDKEIEALRCIMEWIERRIAESKEHLEQVLERHP